MKILQIINATDLDYNIGCTPLFWMLSKSLANLGVELETTSFLGDTINTTWWKSLKNPNKSLSSFAYKSNLLLSKVSKSNSQGMQSSLVGKLLSKFAQSKWRKYLRKLLNENQYDLIFGMNLPSKFFSDIFEDIKVEYNLPVLLYDGDAPVSLPSYGGFETGISTEYFGDLHIYDHIFTNSGGSFDEYKKFGAKSLSTLHWAVDEQLYQPRGLEKTIDNFYYAHGTEYREEWLEHIYSSVSLKNCNSVIGGGLNIDNSEGITILPKMTIPEMIKKMDQSKINFNIARDSHRLKGDTSSARPFELASMSSAIISNPYKGLEKWFEPEKEIIIASDYQEFIEIYEVLLDDQSRRRELGIRARKRVQNDHTYENRANQLISKLNEFI